MYCEGETQSELGYSSSGIQEKFSHHAKKTHI